MARSRGAILLARTGKTQDQIAEIAGVTRVAVSQWMSGSTKPGRAKRDTLAASLEVPVAAWDDMTTPAMAIGSTTPPPPREDSDVPQGVLGKAARLEDMAHRLMVDLQHDEESSPLERAKVMASIAQTLGLLAKLTGQMDLGTRLFKLPTWKRIEEALGRALEQHPKAARDVARELRAVDAELRLTFDT